jgi:hypothetical protein
MSLSLWAHPASLAPIWPVCLARLCDVHAPNCRFRTSWAADADR